MKPNAMSYESASQLQKEVDASTPAGVQSEFRKASPDVASARENSGNNNPYGLARQGMPSPG